MRKMIFYIPSAKCGTKKKPKTKHSPLSPPQPSSPPPENITYVGSQKQILHRARERSSGPLIVFTLGTG